MRTLMTGPAWVAYGQIYVNSSERHPELPESFAGQQNGLCGAAVAGTLFLTTGLHTGEVGFGVELYDEEPVIDDTWEEIVEASFRPVGDVALVGWGGEGYWPLELETVDYRVRYCGWGMDAGHQAAPPMGDEPLVDRYLLQFWPAPPKPDRVVKQTSKQAAYWHAEARKTPPPPTPEQRAAKRRERERREAEEKRVSELEAWGGHPPSDRLREIWKAYHLARVHRPLLDALDDATPDTQWAVARWIARRTAVEAELDQVGWIAAALDGLDAGDDPWTVLRMPAEVFGPGSGDGPVLTVSSGSWSDNLDLPAKAMLIVSPFYYDDPLEAAIETLWVADGVFGADRAQELSGELRRAFPEVTNPAG